MLDTLQDLGFESCGSLCSGAQGDNAGHAKLAGVFCSVGFFFVIVVVLFYLSSMSGVSGLSTWKSSPWPRSPLPGSARSLWLI